MACDLGTDEPPGPRNLPASRLLENRDMSYIAAFKQITLKFKLTRRFCVVLLGEA